MNKTYYNLAEIIAPCCLLRIPRGACKYSPREVTKADGVFLLHSGTLLINLSVLTSAAWQFPISKIWSQRQGHLNRFSLDYTGVTLGHVDNSPQNTQRRKYMSILGQSSLLAASSLVLKSLAQPYVTEQYHRENQFECNATLAGLT